MKAGASVFPSVLTRVHDYGIGDGTNEPYLVMDFVDGRPLSAILVQKRTMVSARVRGIVAQTGPPPSDGNALKVARPHRDQALPATARWPARRGLASPARRSMDATPTPHAR